MSTSSSAYLLAVRCRNWSRGLDHWPRDAPEERYCAREQARIDTPAGEM